MKMSYKEPELKVCVFDEADAIRTSGPTNENTMLSTWFDGYGDLWENN